MKIKKYKCRCGHDDFFLSAPENCIGENHVGIYCSYCGKWFKWADKDEKNLPMNCVTKIRNDLIKNGDDLIKRQDAIDACFNGKCANIYDCKEAIEKIPSAQKIGKWIPCSERLPEHTGFYLIQHSRECCADEMAVAFFSVEEHEIDPDDCWEFSSVGDVQEVIAWMPLPKPYTEE